MGTCNYCTSNGFDLYIYDEDLDDTLDKDEAIDTYNFYMRCAYEEACELVNKINSLLTFYKLEIRDGYYTGIQIVIDDLHPYIEDYDNNDCHYEFDMCRSVALRKKEAERKRINKKFLPRFKNELCWEQIRIVGVFSNGEAIYERVR